MRNDNPKTLERKFRRKLRHNHHHRNIHIGSWIQKHRITNVLFIMFNVSIKNVFCFLFRRYCVTIIPIGGKM